MLGSLPVALGSRTRSVQLTPGYNTHLMLTAEGPVPPARKEGEIPLRAPTSSPSPHDQPHPTPLRQPNSVMRGWHPEGWPSDPTSNSRALAILRVRTDGSWPSLDKGAVPPDASSTRSH